MKRTPSNFSLIGEVIPNCDHDIDATLIPRLINEEVYATYSAWHFHGRILCEDSN